MDKVSISILFINPALNWIWKNNQILLLHFQGPDGGQFDYVDVFTRDKGYRCLFSKFMDNGDIELGHDCGLIAR